MREEGKTGGERVRQNGQKGEGMKDGRNGRYGRITDGKDEYINE